MNSALQHVLTNWKTTVSSLLTALIGAGAYFAAVPTAALQQNGITQKEIFWGAVIVGLAKIALGAIQTDAKTPQPPLAAK